MSKDVNDETSNNDHKHEINSAAAPREEIQQLDEFGLKIKAVDPRRFEDEESDQSLSPESNHVKIRVAGENDEEEEEEEDGGEAFRTPMTNARSAGNSISISPHTEVVPKHVINEEQAGKHDKSSGDEQMTPKLASEGTNGQSEKHRNHDTSTDAVEEAGVAAPDSQAQQAIPEAFPRVAAGSLPTSRPVSRPASLALRSRSGTHKSITTGYSHLQIVSQQQDPQPNEEEGGEGEWQEMPAFATHTVYDDWGKILAHEEALLDDEKAAYGHLGGAGKGYTKVQMDEDALSATSMDENTAYLFNQKTTAVLDEEGDPRDVVSQMQATKEILEVGQRIAYVGVVKITAMDMVRDIEQLAWARSSKKVKESSFGAHMMWSQKVMLRLYGHMDISAAEQIMIEQLAEHGVRASDLTPVLMQHSLIKNPTKDQKKDDPQSSNHEQAHTNDLEDEYAVKSPSDLKGTEKIDVDIRWTILCDLFLVLVADSSYDARSRTLLERVGKALDVEWLDICKFEKRVTNALEMQEAADKENWNEDQHMEQREKSARTRRYVMMGLATVGGGLVIGLSAGILAPVIGAGLAAGFTTFGLAGTGTILGSAGAAAVITSTGVVTGSTIAVRASSRRFGAVKTFEYRPLYNTKRVNLIITVAGWMNGKVDDVRLPFSTVDPIMGDIYSVLWEPEMLQSMGQTINILATEALTQGLQALLGSTILAALMSALSLPLILTKLSYLIDNPWNVSLARADQAGLILADSLIDRNLGSRPVTLCGFSIGSRVIYSCLKELANKGAYGLVQNVYLYGSPMVANKDEYTKARAAVSGRFLNGYATNDWILGYLFRATSGGIMRVAGLAPVELPGIENVNCTEHVKGHMAYRTAMPKLLQEAGWSVESLEFTEIEDADPENHEMRQRELLNEIEQARKQLEKKPSKKGLRALFSKNKKLAEKKEWETYDDRVKTAPLEADLSTNVIKLEDVEGDHPTGLYDESAIFDIDAIRKEVVQIASTQKEDDTIRNDTLQVREIKSTLPPMKINVQDLPTQSITNRDMNGHDRLSDNTDSSNRATSPATPISSQSHKKPSSSSWWKRKTNNNNNNNDNHYPNHHSAPNSAIGPNDSFPSNQQSRTNPPSATNIANEEHVEDPSTPKMTFSPTTSIPTSPPLHQRPSHGIDESDNDDDDNDGNMQRMSPRVVDDVINYDAHGRPASSAGIFTGVGSRKGVVGEVDGNNAWIDDDERRDHRRNKDIEDGEMELTFE